MACRQRRRDGRPVDVAGGRPGRRPALRRRGQSRQQRRLPFDAAALGTDAAGFTLQVRGDGNRYRLRVYTRDPAHGGENVHSHYAAFDTRAGEIVEVQLRWPQFTASFRGRPVPQAPPIRFADVTGIGVMITRQDHRAGRGPFVVELLRIEPLPP
jgi:hypothetical protein